MWIRRVRRHEKNILSGVREKEWKIGTNHKKIHKKKPKAYD